MKRTSSDVKGAKARRRMVKRFLVLAVLSALAYGAWYGYCHYYPRFKYRGNTTAEVVPERYRFGDVNDVHLRVARKTGIKPVERRSEVDTKRLEKIVSCRYYKVERLTHSVPYLTAGARDLLEEMGKRFQEALAEAGLERHRIIVTSVLRTGEDVKRLQKVNGNASENSAHQYATTFDITYIRYDRQSLRGNGASYKELSAILGRVIEKLRKERALLRQIRTSAAVLPCYFSPVVGGRKVKNEE